MLKSPEAALTVRCQLIKDMVDDLSRVNGGDTPISRALADAIIKEVDGLARAIKQALR